MKTAFVLSGGSIKGAFQAGAISHQLVQKQAAPDLIFGTSVGSLNGLFLTDRAGKYVRANQPINWVQIGKDLEEFWLEKITNFKKLGHKTCTVKLGWHILRNKFNGFLNMQPLYDLIEQEFSYADVLAAPINFCVCSVNLQSGKTIYTCPQESTDFFEYVKASTAIPLTMPTVKIAKQPHADGGVREVAPLKIAIDAKADHIVAILCHPEAITEESVDWGNILTFVDRNMSIITAEILLNDIETCLEINDILASLPAVPQTGPLAGKRHVHVKIVRPEKPLDIDLEKFDKFDIQRIFDLGWQASQNA